MSTEAGVEKRRLSRSSSESKKGPFEDETDGDIKSSDNSNTKSQLDEQPNKEEEHGGEKDADKDGGAILGKEEGKDSVKPSTNINRNNVIPGDGSRQIIAVSANKNPTAFFQLARKFLMTNEMCDLSALEGAIVSAVDAAHLLERSKLASIVRIHTSYVNVEPKRRRQVSQQRSEVTSANTAESLSSLTATSNALPCSDGESPSITSNVSTATNMADPPQIPSFSSSSIPDSKTFMDVSATQQTGQQSITASSNKNLMSSTSGSNRELRRARILVTVKRTESYKRWLEENPSQRQAIIAGTANVTAEDIVGGRSSSNDEQT